MMTKTFTASQFADLIATYPVAEYDRRIGVAWLQDDGPTHQAVDADELRAYQEGSQDGVTVVFSENGRDAVALLEQLRENRRK